MDIKSLEELREPDERTLHFNPLGLGGRMAPEDAAAFQQELISHAELVPAVAEGTRNTFDRLRQLYAYGVLFYDAFTVVETKLIWSSKRPCANGSLSSTAACAV